MYIKFNNVNLKGKTSPNARCRLKRKDLAAVCVQSAPYTFSGDS